MILILISPEKCFPHLLALRPIIYHLNFATIFMNFWVFGLYVTNTSAEDITENWSENPKDFAFSNSYFWDDLDWVYWLLLSVDFFVFLPSLLYFNLCPSMLGPRIHLYVSYLGLLHGCCFIHTGCGSFFTYDIII